MPLGLQPFSGKGLEAYRAPLARLNIWDGAVRSGKTLSSLMRWAKWVREEAPPGGLMMAGKTERTLKQNVVDPLLDIFPSRHIKYSAGNHELVLFGRRHILVGTNDARADAKIRGITLAGVYGDEVTLWGEDFFTMALSRLSLEGSIFMGTTNPDSPAHWLNKRYLARADELGLKRWQFKLDDNPYLTKTFVDQIKKEYTGLWYKRFIEGLWVVAEGAVYPMLSEDFLVDSLPKDIQWTYGGVDVGTTNPTVALALSYANTSPTGSPALFIHHEKRHDAKASGKQLTMAEQSTMVRAWTADLPKRPKKLYIDPSANSFILQLWRDGLRANPMVHAGENDVLPGIQDIGSLMANNLLYFHKPTTDHTWDEMASYAWDSKATERGEDKPLKVEDHGPDALRYVIRGTRNIWKRKLSTKGEV